MNYIVIELQTNASGAIAPLVSATLDGPHAEQKYHTILAAAAVSEVPKHSAVILNEKGEYITGQCYDRTVPAPEEGM